VRRVALDKCCTFRVKKSRFADFRKFIDFASREKQQERSFNLLDCHLLRSKILLSFQLAFGIRQPAAFTFGFEDMNEVSQPHFSLFPFTNINKSGKYFCSSSQFFDQGKFRFI